jgi:hypothetical protein
MMKSALTPPPDPSRRHPIHAGDRVWAETNCYADVWIELLHAWGLDPVAGLAFTLAIDFEGDQWTFFKFPAADLDELCGLDVQELAIWRPLAAHVEEQVGQGRPVLVELDSFHLPDTAGTAYRREHVKTTVAAVEIDAAARRLGYFHNQGYYHLDEEDFAGAFRLGDEAGSDHLPPFAELVKRRPGQAPRGGDLTRASLRLLQRHLGRLPAANPFPRFRARFEADLPCLAAEPPDTFHKYAFATLRQFGACYELAATYLHWLDERTGLGLDAPAAALAGIAAGAKATQFQLARALARRKTLDLSVLDRLADAWHDATTRLLNLPL